MLFNLVLKIDQLLSKCYPGWVPQYKLQVRVNCQPGRQANWFVAGLRQPKIVHNHDVRDGMAEFVVPLRKEIKDCLTRQGM